MKLAVYWTGSCGGCDVSFLELGPALLDVLSQVEIVFWPALVDTKRKDLEKFPARSIDVTLVNGVIRTAENQEMVEILAGKIQVPWGVWFLCPHGRDSRVGEPGQWGSGIRVWSGISARTAARRGGGGRSTESSSSGPIFR